eukprot:scaffold15105_cov36-Cyclotella_meneghiniana.AAC.2
MGATPYTPASTGDHQSIKLKSEGATEPPREKDTKQHTKQQLIQIKSEGPFVTAMDRHTFFKLLTVYPGNEAHDGEDPVQSISWNNLANDNKKTTRPSLLNQCLRNLPVFSNYDCRYDSSPRVIAQFDPDVKNSPKKRKVVDDFKSTQTIISRRPDQLVAYVNFRCSQHDRRNSPRKYFCNSTGTLGFTYGDIVTLFASPHVETIPLHGKIHSNCEHVKGVVTNRIIGEDRVSIGNQLTHMKPIDVFEMYNPNNKKDGITMKSCNIAYNIMYESSGHSSKKPRKIPPKKGAECNDDGKVKSEVYPDFLAMNPDLTHAIITIFDSLFLNPSHGPAISGKGISLSVHSIYGSKPTLNIHRRGSYLRQNFGRDDPTKTSGKSETVYRYTYGTGSGLVTNGIVTSHLVFQAFTQELDLIADRSMKIQPHRDQRYTTGGKFYEKMNSQIQHTITAILVVGDPRQLTFQLYKQGRKQEVVSQDENEWSRQVFQLEHGALFILKPQDEETRIRSFFKEFGPTFFKHESSGLRHSKDDMSLGVVLRTTAHSLEVERMSGKIVTNNKQDSKTIECEKIMEDYLHINNAEAKMRDDNEIRDKWISCRNKYL